MSDETLRLPIRRWPEDERPRERLIRYGPEGLSDAQLLAILLRTGESSSGTSAIDVARDLIGRFDSLRAMDAASISELCSIKGVGEAKATQIKAAFELGKRYLSGGSEPQLKFLTTQEVARRYFPTLCNVKKEVFKLLLLDNKVRLIKDVTVAEGDLSSSIVHPREVFNPAVRESAAAVIFVHNHPSGDPAPSSNDREITSRLVSAGEIMGINVLDHIIIGDGRYYSFKEEGIIK